MFRQNGAEYNSFGIYFFQQFKDMNLRIIKYFWKNEINEPLSHNLHPDL